MHIFSRTERTVASGTLLNLSMEATAIDTSGVVLREERLCFVREHVVWLQFYPLSEWLRGIQGERKWCTRHTWWRQYHDLGLFRLVESSSSSVLCRQNEISSGRKPRIVTLHKLIEMSWWMCAVIEAKEAKQELWVLLNFRYDFYFTAEVSVSGVEMAGWGKCLHPLLRHKCRGGGWETGESERWEERKRNENSYSTVVLNESSRKWM